MWLNNGSIVCNFSWNWTFLFRVICLNCLFQFCGPRLSKCLCTVHTTWLEVWVIWQSFYQYDVCTWDNSGSTNSLLALSQLLVSLIGRTSASPFYLLCIGLSAVPINTKPFDNGLTATLPSLPYHHLCWNYFSVVATIHAHTLSWPVKSKL